MARLVADNLAAGAAVEVVKVDKGYYSARWVLWLPSLLYHMLASDRREL